MKRPALIDGWQRGYRLKTIRACALLATLSLIEAQLLPLLQIDFPSRVWPYVSLGFAAWIAYVRLLAQPGALQDGSAPDSPSDDTPQHQPADRTDGP